MKTIIPIVIIGMLVLTGIGVMAETQPQYASKVVEVTGGIGHISVTIINYGYASLDDFEYSVTINGGLAGKIDVSETCALGVLPTQTTEVSNTNDFIFGFGKISISIDADYAETWVGTGFVVGPFIFDINGK